MKTPWLLVAAFALTMPSCSAAPRVDARCIGPLCARGSNETLRGGNPYPFAGFRLASAVTPHEAPPIALTAGDGTALELTELEAATVVDGPLAFTELRLSFTNPEERRIEGRFRIALPTGASISRFGMKIAGRWQEGEVVEKRRATQIYEDFLHQKVDPALLEQGAGNEFSARVFPIEAKQKKELVLSYSQELSSAPSTIVPLRGLGRVGRLSTAVYRAGSEEVKKVASDHVPDSNITLAAATPNEAELGPATPLTGSDGLRHGRHALVRVRPSVAAEADPLSGVLMLVDTSGSRALDLSSQLRIAQGLAGRIARTEPASPLVIAAFDQSVEQVYAGRAGDAGTDPFERLERRGALGASDPERALRWARQVVATERLKRLVLIGDGVATAGDSAPHGLREVTTMLGRAGVARIDAIATGGLRDDDLLETLVTGDIERHGVVVNATTPAETMWRRMTHRTRSVSIDVKGAEWSWPRRAHGLGPDDEVLVYATLGDGDDPVRLEVDGAPLAPSLAPASEGTLLDRAWARARIESLLERERRDGPSDDRTRQIVELSTRHRVMSPYTSLLVLEQEWHYSRYGVDRNALADIMTVTDGRVAVMRRSGKDLPRVGPTEQGARAAGTRAQGEEGSMGNPRIGSTDPLDATGNMWGDEIGDAFGAGGLGLTGIGEGGGGRGDGLGLGSVGTIGRGAGTGQGVGFGSGHGRLGRSHRARPPQVRMGATQVAGRIPPEVIQRVVRQHFGRMRSCYEDARRRNANAQGRVAVRFVIARDGSVNQASVSQSELRDGSLEQCVLDAFAGMKFPPPEGGIVTVTYPFVFTPGEDEAQAPPRQAFNINRWPRPPVPGSTPVPAPEKPRPAAPYKGAMAHIMAALENGRIGTALELAENWRREAPGEVVPLIALGEAFEVAGLGSWAARAYGSIIDLYPSRTDLRRYAGARLERLGHGAALELAVDTYSKAREQRPDHPSSHRLHAYALLKRGQHKEAFDVVKGALARGFAASQYPSVERVLREDLGLIAASWIAQVPARRVAIIGELVWAGAELADQPSLRFVLNWETDTNDVDFHVFDASGHASYERPELPSGGALYADVTRGFGPECFTILGPPSARSERYRLQAHYYSRGPMGYGMGKVQVIEHDGKGGLRFDERPFLLMVDDGWVDLGDVRGTS